MIPLFSSRNPAKPRILYALSSTQSPRGRCASGSSTSSVRRFPAPPIAVSTSTPAPKSASPPPRLTRAKSSPWFSSPWLSARILALALVAAWTSCAASSHCQTPCAARSSLIRKCSRSPARSLTRTLCCYSVGVTTTPPPSKAP